jgi:hypothetical protein
MKINYKSKLAVFAALAVVSLGGVGFGVAHAATGSTNTATASAAEDNGKDGETNDDTKTSAATPDTDNVQDGETNDDPAQ